MRACPGGAEPWSGRCRVGLVVCLVLGLVACGVPVPEEKSAYVGTWRAENMHLRIYASGRIEYQRRDGGHTKKISGPIKAYEGDDFIVGIGFLSTRFRVQKPPVLDRGAWRMVVDGVELVRADAASDWSS